jgi:hypothetical protein
MDDALQPAYPLSSFGSSTVSSPQDRSRIGEIVPPAVIPPTDAIIAGRVKLTRPLKGARIPLASYELNSDRDFGITQGGQSVAFGDWGQARTSQGA